MKTWERNCAAPTACPPNAADAHGYLSVAVTAVGTYAAKQ
jgi:hypothetical protein